MRASLKYRLVNKFGYFVASLPAVGNFCYKLAQSLVRCHDNDANSDFYSNGECYLLNHFIKNQLLKTVFDVGANIGDYTSLIVCSKQKDAKIYAFDPKDGNIEHLKQRFGREESDSVYDMSTIGCFSKRNKISVPCTTIDNFSAENHIDHINLIKIDVEGHELSVLMGGGEDFIGKEK